MTQAHWTGIILVTYTFMALFVLWNILYGIIHGVTELLHWWKRRQRIKRYRRSLNPQWR